VSDHIIATVPLLVVYNCNDFIETIRAFQITFQSEIWEPYYKLVRSTTLGFAPKINLVKA